MLPNPFVVPCDPAHYVSDQIILATKISGYLDRTFLRDNAEKVCLDAPNIKGQAFLIIIQGDKISFRMLPVWLAFVLNQDEWCLSN